jgi:hypothetical protein
MADSAENNVKQSGNFIRSLIQTLTEWLKNLGEYLEKYAATAPQRELGAWLSKNGGNVYVVRGGCTYDLKNALAEAGIGFIQDTNNPNYLIIRQPDTERVEELNRQVLVARCNYYQEVDGRELEDAIARASKTGKISDAIVTVHNLNTYQTEVLKNKFNDISYGYTVGITEGEKDKSNISVPAAKVYSKDEGKKDLCRAYLEMSFSLYGLNSYKKTKQIDADRDFDKKIAAMKGQQRSVYIAGADDIGQFLEINGNGFEYYTVKHDADGNRIENEVHTCRADSPDYDVELQIYLDKMRDKVILNSSEELANHLNTKDRNYNSDRPEKTKRERRISRAEDEMVKKIDSMIRKDIKDNDRSFDTPDECFSYYQHEADGILAAAINGTSYKEYSAEDIARINKICEDRKVDISRYASVQSALRGIDVETHKAKEFEPEKRREVQQNYDKSAR